jgi:hypothetical protein
MPQEQAQLHAFGTCLGNDLIYMLTNLTSGMILDKC